MPFFPMHPPPYAKSMETEHNKALFDGMYETRMMLSEAIDRCKYVAMTEKVMGYPESWATYEDLANELKEVKIWIEKHMHTLLELK